MGVVVFKHALDIQPSELKYLQRRGMQGTTILNPDNLRVQTRLRADCHVVQRVLKLLQDRGLLQDRRFGGAVVLHSFPACRQQVWHRDYDPKRVGRVLPLGVIVALDTNWTKFCTPTATYRLKQGDVLCFTGDVVHAGASYERPNTRLHLYLDAHDCKGREKDEVYLWRS